jgi:Kef-type K+ transport system membrane component KefB
LCITVYSAVAAAIDLSAATGSASDIAATLYRSGFLFTWQIVGSAALGFLLGLLLAQWSGHVTENGEMLILLAGAILLCVGVARVLDLSPLVASLAVGATMVNLSEGSRRLFVALSGTDPPFYAMFFVLAGAELDVSLIPAMGLLGVVYLVGRAGGKFAGARIAAARLGLGDKIRQLLGFALLAQAGLAVGLTFAIGERYPEFAPVIRTVVLASVAVYEVIGPIATRFALVRAGEANAAAAPAPDPLASVL